MAEIQTKESYLRTVWKMTIATLKAEKKEELGHDPSIEELEPELSQIKALYNLDDTYGVNDDVE